MSIEKIPGYEKTPKEIKRAKDAMRIFEIAGLKVDITDNNLFSNAVTLKKLLDDKRMLLKYLILTMKNIRKAFSLIEKEKAFVDDFFYEITGKTFHELLKVVND